MIVFVIGAPASGKGTLCKGWCSSQGWHHVSVGDRLRELVQSTDPDIDEDIRRRMANNELLTTQDIVRIVGKELKQQESENVMIDGFPWLLEQAKAFEEEAVKPDLVLFFNCSRETATKRYQHRNLPGRDVDPTVFEKRYEQFEALNRAILHEYRERELLIKVDTSGDTDASFEKLKTALSGLLG